MRLPIAAEIDTSASLADLPADPPHLRQAAVGCRPAIAGQHHTLSSGGLLVFMIPARLASPRQDLVRASESAWRKGKRHGSAGQHRGIVARLGLKRILVDNDLHN